MDPINKIGEKAPQFQLIDLEGTVYSPEVFEGKDHCAKFLVSGMRLVCASG